MNFPIRLGASSLIFSIVVDVLSCNVLQNDRALKNPEKSFKSFFFKRVLLVDQNPNWGTKYVRVQRSGIDTIKYHTRTRIPMGK